MEVFSPDGVVVPLTGGAPTIRYFCGEGSGIIGLIGAEPNHNVAETSIACPEAVLCNVLGIEAAARSVIATLVHCQLLCELVKSIDVPVFALVLVANFVGR